MRYYFAPLEGVGGYIFRNAYVHYYGGADKYFTPFLSGPKLGYKEVNDILPENNDAKPIIPQILSNKSEVFLEVARALTAYGYDEVNLNLGCPSGTVVSKKRGSGFLSVPDELERFLDEVCSDSLFAEGKMKLSVKTRIGMEDTSEWAGLVGIFSKFPLHELIIHPRLRRELYGGTPHRDAVAHAYGRLKELSGACSCENIVFNGDICSQSDLDALRGELPFIDTVMIGRGMLKNPEIFNNLKSAESSAGATGTSESSAASTPLLPTDASPLRSSPARLSTFLAFHNELLESYEGIMYGEKPVLFKMKELWAWFSEYCKLDTKELKKLRKAGSIAEYKACMLSLFENA